MFKLIKKLSFVLCAFFTAAAVFSLGAEIRADEIPYDFPDSFNFRNLVRATDSNESFEFAAFCGGTDSSGAYIVAFNTVGVLGLDDATIYNSLLTWLPSDVYADGIGVSEEIYCYQVFESQLIEDTLGFIAVYYTDELSSKLLSRIGDMKMAPLSSVSEGDKVFIATFDNPEEVVADYGYVESVQEDDGTFIVNGNNEWVDNNSILWVGAPIVNKKGECVGVVFPQNLDDPYQCLVYSLDDAIDYLSRQGVLYSEKNNASSNNKDDNQKNDNNDKNDNKNSDKNDDKNSSKEEEDSPKKNPALIIIILSCVGAAVAGIFFFMKKKSNNAASYPNPQGNNQQMPQNYNQQMPQNYSQQAPQPYNDQPAPQPYNGQQAPQPFNQQNPQPFNQQNPQPVSQQNYQMFNQQDSLEINHQPATTLIEPDIFLKCIGGTLNGNSYPLTGSICIGRNPSLCDVVYPNSEPGISSFHCQVVNVNGNLQIIDMDSSEGTFLNNTKISPNTPYSIAIGSSFYLGSPVNAFMIAH